MQKYILVFMMAFLLMSCNSHKDLVTVTNKADIDLTDKVVTLSRAQVEAKVGTITANKIVVVYDEVTALPSQCDDLDGDGVWDELAFLTNLKTGQTQKLSLKLVDVANAPVFVQRTNIRFGQKNAPFAEITTDKRLKSDDSPTISQIYQMEGPAWENDVVGFRNYYDARNGIDIFGKRTSAMVLDSAGIRGQDYHKLDTWGMDILKVANSLGAGAIAITIADSVYRVGPSNEGTYRFITEGPVRAMLEFTYKGVAAGNQTYNVKHRIGICAGNAFYCSKVWVDGLQGNETVTTGIVHKYERPLIEDASAGYKILATHGNQAFDHEVLGLGLMIPESQFVRNYTSPMTGPGVTETYLADIKISENAPAEYLFFSGWELQDANYKSVDFFVAKLKESAAKMAAVVEVK